VGIVIEWQAPKIEAALGHTRQWRGRETKHSYDHHTCCAGKLAVGQAYLNHSRRVETKGSHVRNLRTI
jgi:hypothetical protein